MPADFASRKSAGTDWDIILKSKKVIIKSSGQIEPFSPTKLLASVERTGLDQKCCNEIANEISKKIRQKATTKEIFKQTVRLIKHRSPIAAIRYSLKKSLSHLGPSGYEFEKFVAHYFEALGYQTKVGQKFEGKYVRHEVDVVAQKGEERIFVECKFHNNSARKNDIKTVLYVKARWDDLREAPGQNNITSYYLVTNTAFSKDALVYSEGVGLKLLGVNAPEKNSFLDMIKNLKLYPITSLVRLKKKYTKALLAQDILLCSDLYRNQKMMVDVGMNQEEINYVLSDIKKLIDI